MIKYSLRCSNAHEFEGWFRSSGDFDAQKSSDELTCPVCGSGDVEKAIMAPAVATRRSSNARLAEIQGAMAEAATRARDYIEKNFEHVGGRFPEEARKIHYGEAEARPIYGEASLKEAKELRDEGVEVAPAPGFAPKREAAGPAKPKLAGKPKEPKKAAAPKAPQATGTKASDGDAEG